VAACPTGAREMLGRRMTTEQVVREVLRDRLFYDDSGGGVTISGGEPLSQPSFLQALVKAFDSQSLHIAVDTCGYAPQQVLLDIVPFVDLFLYDIKVLDSALHMRHTGVSNRLILENLQLLSQVHDQIWFRVPLIPGFNTDELPQIAQYVAAIPSIKQVHILPYHELGLYKRTRGHLPSVTCVESLTEQQLEAAADTFRACGLNTLIGG
jgi:pyruvate formate lyase activating enzyme